MKNSMAVFSNQGNPFPPPATSRTHYRPSQPQTLSEEQKQTPRAVYDSSISFTEIDESYTADSSVAEVLSPVRLHHHLSDALSPPDLHFLDGSQRFVHGLPESDSSGPFDESWPSSEGSNKTPEQERMRTGGCDSADPNKEESVIARYMARFRTGRPTSRRERSPSEPAMKEFWWLQTSPDSPDAPRFRSGISAALGFSPQSLDMTPPLPEGSLNDSKLCPDDVDIIGLQERARKLILQSESSLSSGGPVSSEGIGSSPSSVSDVSGVRSSSMDRAPVVPVPPVALPSMPITLPTPSLRAHNVLPPEEDVLYQWRLRRKMEQAREGILPVTTRKRSPSPPVRIPKQVLPVADFSEMIVQVPPSLTAASSHVAPCAQTPTSCFSHVPLASPHVESHSIAPHMQTPTSCFSHVPLASPHVESHSIAPRAQTPTSCFSYVRLASPHVEPNSIAPPMQPPTSCVSHMPLASPHVEPNSIAPPMQPPTSCVSHMPLASPHVEPNSIAPHAQTSTSCVSHVPLASPHLEPHSISGVVPPHLHLQCDILPCVNSQQPAPYTPPKQETVTKGPAIKPTAPAQPAEKGQLSEPSEKHKTLPEKLPHKKSQKVPDKPQDKKVKSKRSERTSDKSGPERALQGPPTPSPVHQAMEQVITERLFSPPQSPKLKPKKRTAAPPPEEEEEIQPVEIAAYLLEEAEDSDGTEFRDDPLLQVLREQRQSLRSRLREVDLRLAELQGETNASRLRPQ